MSSPPSREKSLDRMTSIIRIGHDTRTREHQSLLNAVNEIIQFGLEPMVNDRVYQYEQKNQKQILKPLSLLQSASSSIQPVITKQKIDLFKLEMQMPPDMEFSVPTTEPPKKDEKEKPQQSFTDKLLGRKTKRIINTSDPYQSNISEFQSDVAKIKQLELFIEYQAFGVKKALRYKPLAMIVYKSFHYNRFQFNIAPAIIRLHRQYIDNLLSTEKQYATQVAIGIQSELQRIENAERRM